MNLRLLCSVCFHTVWHWAVVLGSIVFYYGFLALYSILRPGALNGVGKSDNAYFVIFEVCPSDTRFPAEVSKTCVILSPTLLADLISDNRLRGERKRRYPFNIPETMVALVIHGMQTGPVLLQLLGKPAFWLSMVLGVVAALLPDLTWQGICRAYFPLDQHLIQVVHCLQTALATLQASNQCSWFPLVPWQVCRAAKLIAPGVRCKLEHESMGISHLLTAFPPFECS